MRLITASTLALLLTFSVPSSADSGGVSIKEHEIAASSMSLKRAFQTYSSEIKEGNRYEALPYARRVYELVQAKPTDSAKNLKMLAAAALNYGRLLVFVNNKDEASNVLKRSLEILEKLHGEESIELLDTLMDLGHASNRFGRSDAGRKYYKRAIKIATAHSNPDSPLVAQLYFEMSEQFLLHGVGNQKRAIKDLTRAHAIFRDKLGQSNGRTALAAYRLGEVSTLKRDYREAADYLEAAVSVFDQHTPYERLTEKTHSLLIDVYEQLGQSNKATKHCQAVGKIKEAWNEKPQTGYELMPLYRKAPHYPRSANMRGIEGYAVLELTVTEEGRTKDFQVLEWHGSEDFAKAGITAARKFRYAVRYEDGKPAETTGVRYKFTFNLAN